MHHVAFKTSHGGGKSSRCPSQKSSQALTTTGLQHVLTKTPLDLDHGNVTQGSKTYVFFSGRKTICTFLTERNEVNQKGSNGPCLVVSIGILSILTIARSNSCELFWMLKRPQLRLNWRTLLC